MVPEGKPGMFCEDETAQIRWVSFAEAVELLNALTGPVKQAEQLQQDFIANMTHELRSPLTSIKAALELMSRDDTKDTGSRNVLNTAIRNTELGLELHSNLNALRRTQKAKELLELFGLAHVARPHVARDRIDREPIGISKAVSERRGFSST